MVEISKLVSWFVIVNQRMGSAQESLTQMKLMSLLYYVQGTYLALYDEPAFSNEILAWKYGPAVAAVHKQFRGQKRVGHQVTVQDEANYKEVNANDNLLKVMFEVQETFGTMTTAELRQLVTHQTPWEKTPQSEPIDLELIKRYFERKIVKVEK